MFVLLFVLSVCISSKKTIQENVRIIFVCVCVCVCVFLLDQTSAVDAPAVRMCVSITALICQAEASCARVAPATNLPRRTGTPVRVWNTSNT